MLKPKSEKISAGSILNFSEDAIRINSESFIIDNAWVSFSGTIFKIREYIKNVVVGNRTRFFKDRNYAVYLLICLDLNDGIKVVEGTQVPFSSFKAVPPPQTYDALPLIGLILVQDGTIDLNYGFNPIENDNINYFSGSGNIIDHDVKGVRGDSNDTFGETGQTGVTGLKGFRGSLGETGLIGSQGPTEIGEIGELGLHGMTGINWDIQIQFDRIF